MWEGKQRVFFLQGEHFKTRQGRTSKNLSFGPVVSESPVETKREGIVMTLKGDLQRKNQFDRILYVYLSDFPAMYDILRFPAPRLDF